jgi:hypothetical protein
MVKRGIALELLPGSGFHIRLHDHSVRNIAQHDLLRRRILGCHLLSPFLFFGSRRH